MPGVAKGTRLWLEPAERNPQGKIVRNSSWVIRDGSRKIRTGCTRDDRAGAEQDLADYIASKYTIPRESGRHPAQILVLDVLNLYLADVAPRHSDPDITKSRILTLADWWGEKTLAEVNGEACRAYAEFRARQPRRASKPHVTGNAPRMVTKGGARRELEDLRAAINHHRSEGLCSEIVAVKLPEKSTSRDVWLTRHEAAKIVWAAWRARQKIKDTDTKRDVGRHVARFILVGLYTGTRHGAICSAAFQPAVGRGHVDLDAGIFYRQRQGETTTKKRQPPVKLSDRLLAHLRRWHRMGIAKHAVVEWNGKPVASVRKGFAAAVKAAGIDPEKQATPHILRHTAATWAMQNGAEIWATAGFLGMSAEVLEKVYGHHHPDFQNDVARKLAGQDRDRLTVNKRALSSSNVTKITNKTRGL